jgi:hypothetical protein
MLVVHRDTVGPHEISRIDGLQLTSPERTAPDLARWAPTLTEHLRPDRALRDLEREQLLVRAGWRILRCDRTTPPADDRHPSARRALS